MAQAETTMSSHHQSTREVSNASNSIALIPEDLMLRKFGSSHPKLKLMRKSSTRKRFDSGDWCLERLGLTCKDEVPNDVPMDQLSPKLNPEPTPLPRARSSLQYTSSPFDPNYDNENSESSDNDTDQINAEN